MEAVKSLITAGVDVNDRDVVRLRTCCLNHQKPKAPDSAQPLPLLDPDRNI